MITIGLETSQDSWMSQSPTMNFYGEIEKWPQTNMSAVCTHDKAKYFGKKIQNTLSKRDRHAKLWN